MRHQMRWRISIPFFNSLWPSEVTIYSCRWDGASKISISVMSLGCFMLLCNMPKQVLELPWNKLLSNVISGVHYINFNCVFWYDIFKLIGWKNNPIPFLFSISIWSMSNKIHTLWNMSKIWKPPQTAGVTRCPSKVVSTNRDPLCFLLVKWWNNSIFESNKHNLLIFLLEALKVATMSLTYFI